MHGLHHVAQKSSTTTFPRRPSRLTVPPPRSLSAKEGAAPKVWGGGVHPRRVRPNDHATRIFRRRIRTLYRRPRSADLSERGEQPGEVAGEERQAVRHEEQAHAHEKGPRHVLHDPHVTPEAGEGAEEAVDGEARGDEGKPEAEGIGRQENDSLPDGVLLRGVKQDGPEDGP